MTTLHAGGKFNSGAYYASGGLHGVGVSVVNALSEYLEVYVKREGHVYYQKYERGKPVSPFQEIGKTERQVQKSAQAMCSGSTKRSCNGAGTSGAIQIFNGSCSVKVGVGTVCVCT